MKLDLALLIEGVTVIGFVMGTALAAALIMDGDVLLAVLSLALVAGIVGALVLHCRESRRGAR